MHVPPLSEILDSMRVVQLPLRKTFRGIDVREAVLFEGPEGWGEFAPFRDHTIEHSANWLAAAIELAYEPFVLPIRNEVPINAIVPALPIDEVATWAEAAHRDYGVTTFKLKCGSPDFADDVARVMALNAVCEAISNSKIRIDINGAWSVDDAILRINQIAELCGERLEYVEQPVSSLAECAVIRSGVTTPIAVDEGVRLLADARMHVEAVRAAGDIAILKAIPLGGVRRALDIAAVLEMPAVVSGSMDTSVGLAQGLALAAALPQLDYACGFLTGSLLAQDVISHPLVPTDGTLSADRVSPELPLLTQLDARVDSDTKNYWRERLIASYRILEAA